MTVPTLVLKRCTGVTLGVGHLGVLGCVTCFCAMDSGVLCNADSCLTECHARVLCSYGPVFCTVDSGIIPRVTQSGTRRLVFLHIFGRHGITRSQIRSWAVMVAYGGRVTTYAGVCMVVAVAVRFLEW